jgi:hypothetical protein
VQINDILRTYNVGLDIADGVVAGNDVKMVSIVVPSKLGTPSAGNGRYDPTQRMFGSSNYCRALLNGTDYFPWELQCTRGSPTNVLEITNFPTWAAGYEAHDITVYFRAQAEILP